METPHLQCYNFLPFTVIGIRKRNGRLNASKLRLDLLLKEAVVHNILNYNFKVTSTIQNSMIAQEYKT